MYIEVHKSQKGKSTRRDSNLRHRFSFYTSCLSSLEGGALNHLTGCPLGSGEKNVRAHLGGRCVKSTFTSSDDSRVDWNACA